MKIKWIALALCAVAFFACQKKEEVAAPAQAKTQTAATTSSAAPAPQPVASLPAGSPIPSNGVALWLVADAAKGDAGGKLAKWSNAAIAGVTASADEPELQPVVVANALNGHAVVRFDGEKNQMKTSIDTSPDAMPEATIFAVFNSKTEAPAPLRKLYGDDDGGYDRAAGLDTRGGGDPPKNYTVFTGKGVESYFALKANETYITADQFTKTDFSGWVNGKAELQKTPADWQKALPNLYIGGTGTSYDEHWQGDLAEMIVYARVLTDQERTQVEEYLAKKYTVPLTR